VALALFEPLSKCRGKPSDSPEFECPEMSRYLVVDPNGDHFKSNEEGSRKTAVSLRF